MDPFLRVGEGGGGSIFVREEGMCVWRGARLDLEIFKFGVPGSP